MAPRLKMAVVGLGRISTAHLVAIQANADLAELVAVCSRREDVSRDVAARYGASRIYARAEDVIADPHVQAIVLCTPNDLHAPMAVAAAQAGKHILVEKPLANTVREADAMIEAAASNHVVLMAAQVRRFFQAILEARRRIEGIGGISSFVQFWGINFQRLPAEWWKSPERVGGSGGAIWMNGPHMLDTLLWLAGSKPAYVYCETRNTFPQWQAEDEVSMLLRFKDGLIANLHLSYSALPYTNERYIIGPKGTLRIVDERELWVNNQQVVAEPFTNYLEGGPEFNRQTREFILAVQEGREPLASGREVRNVIEVMEALALSAKQREVVTLKP